MNDTRGIVIMGCISVKVSSNNTIGLTAKVNKSIVVNTIPITCDCGVDCTCNESLNINVFITPTSQVAVKPKVGGLNISYGIVCSVKKAEEEIPLGVSIVTSEGKFIQYDNYTNDAIGVCVKDDRFGSKKY